MSVIRRSVGYAGALEERLIALRVAKELSHGGKMFESQMPSRGNRNIHLRQEFQLTCATLALESLGSKVSIIVISLSYIRAKSGFAIILMTSKLGEH